MKPDRISENERKLQSIFECVSDGVVVTDLEGVITDVNEKAVRLHGSVSKKDLVGRSVLSTLALCDRERARKRMKELTQKGEVKSGEYVLVREDASEYPAEIGAGLLRHAGGKPSGFVTIVRDITGHKRSEERLRFLSSIVDNTTESILVTDGDFSISYMNRAFSGLFGYELDDLKGKMPDILNAEPTAPEIQERIYRTVASGEACEGENLSRRKDGSTFYCEYRVGPLKDVQGNIYSYLGIQRDVSERVKAEKEFARSKELLEKTFESLENALFLLDEKAPPVILDCNSAAMEIFGYEKQEMLGRTTEFLHVDGKALSEFQETLYPAIEDKGHLLSFEFKMKRKSGEVFPTEHSVHPLLGETGNRFGWVSVVEDLTERKKIRHALEASENRYRSLFEFSPLPLWEEDFSEVKKRLDILKKEGVTDFRAYLDEHAGLVRECVSLVRIVGYNRAVLGLYNATGPESFLPALHRIFSTETYHSFKKELIAISEGRNLLEFETEVRTLDDKRKYTSARWVVVPGCEDTLARVIFSEIDMTAKRHALDALQRSRLRLRELTAHVESVREEERKTMAREIHDELGQSLTALKMDIDWLNTKFSSGEPELKKRLDSMSDLTNETVQTMNKMSSRLRPSVLDDLGFVAAVEWQLDDFRKKTGIAGSLTVESNNITVRKDISIALFRIFQEVLINVARHAKASSVKVKLKWETDNLLITIQDDGVGITSEQIQDPKSFGLVGMQERALFLEGEVMFRGEPGKGTTIIVSVPTSP